MNDMATVQPRRIRPAHPSPIARLKPAPLLLRPEWRVDVPARVGTATTAPVDSREGRARALVAKAARRQAAFQPIEVVCANVEFRARVQAIVAKRGVPQVCARPVTATMPLRRGKTHRCRHVAGAVAGDRSNGPPLGWPVCFSRCARRCGQVPVKTSRRHSEAVFRCGRRICSPRPSRCWDDRNHYVNRERS